MNRAIKIGFLAPYSSIYPNMVPSLISGFYSAIPEKYHDMFQFIPEYIGQGSEKKILEASQKLLYFDRVDILSGFLSYKVLPTIIPTVEKLQKLGFFFDMGEYIPNSQYISSKVFNNSFLLWQAEYALGYWAHKKFGEKGIVISSIYDGGYHLQSAFRQGAVMAGADVMNFRVLEYKPDGFPVEIQIKEALKQIESENPSFVHALFCGSEASDFYKQYKESNLSEGVPLLVSSHMASDEILENISNLNLNFHSASMWSYNSNEDANQLFKKRILEFAGQKPDIFTLLGYETGLLFNQLIPDFQRRDWDDICKKLKTETIEGPRGNRSFYLNSEYATPTIDIEKINIQFNSISKILIEQGKAMQFDHSTYERIHKENVSGWQNPYLCV